MLSEYLLLIYNTSSVIDVECFIEVYVKMIYWGLYENDWIPLKWRCPSIITY